jgi:hypothetical protein
VWMGPETSDAMDVPTILRNTLQQLQAELWRCKLFGTYWWRVKVLLKRHGYGADRRHLLGSYIYRRYYQCR